MELDLNQEPLDQNLTSMIGFDSILNELESAHGRIEDRIRHLEAVTSRARQHQRWRPVPSPVQITNYTGEHTTDNVQDEGGVHQEESGIAVESRIFDSGKSGKRKSTYLIAKALGMETDTSNAEGSTGNFYDCNICLDMARDPVVTCCGHLFCWPCFYQLSFAYPNAKECPVCKGEVTETGIIPIYGNASANNSCELELRENGLRIPPRPRAPRVESIRQQLISQGASSSTIRNIRRLNNLIVGLGERIQLESPNIATGRTNGLLNQSSLETEHSQHTYPHQFSRLFLQGAASFSSLSSALNSAMDSAERLVEDLESYIHGHQMGGSRQLNPRSVNRNSPFSSAATNHSESLTRNAAETNFAAAVSVSPTSRSNDTTAVTDSEIQTTDGSVQISSLDPSSSYRGRTDVSGRASNEPRRRRLR